MQDGRAETSPEKIYGGAISRSPDVRGKRAKLSRGIFYTVLSAWGRERRGDGEKEKNTAVNRELAGKE